MSSLFVIKSKAITERRCGSVECEEDAMDLSKDTKNVAVADPFAD